MKRSLKLAAVVGLTTFASISSGFMFTEIDSTPVTWATPDDADSSRQLSYSIDESSFEILEADTNGDVSSRLNAVRSAASTWANLTRIKLTGGTNRDASSESLEKAFGCILRGEDTRLVHVVAEDLGPDATTLAIADQISCDSEMRLVILRVFNKQDEVPNPYTNPAGTDFPIRWNSTVRDPATDSANLADGEMDLESVLVHEFGHVLGLDHPNAGDVSDQVVPPQKRIGLGPQCVEDDPVKLSDTMCEYGVAGTLDARVLEEDDKKGLKYLYDTTWNSSDGFDWSTVLAVLLIVGGIVTLFLFFPLGLVLISAGLSIGDFSFGGSNSEEHPDENGRAVRSMSFPDLDSSSLDGGVKLDLEFRDSSGKRRKAPSRIIRPSGSIQQIPGINILEGQVLGSSTPVVGMVPFGSTDVSLNGKPVQSVETPTGLLFATHVQSPLNGGITLSYVDSSGFPQSSTVPVKQSNVSVTAVDPPLTLPPNSRGEINVLLEETLKQEGMVVEVELLENDQTIAYQEVFVDAGGTVPISFQIETKEAGLYEYKVHLPASEPSDASPVDNSVSLSLEVTSGNVAANPFPSNESEGDFNPTVDTVLSPGIHNFRSVYIPAGVRVTTTGSGVLELRASGSIRIDGTVDVSGGDGGQGSSGTPGGGGGGDTGNPLGDGMNANSVCVPASSGGETGTGENGTPNNGSQCVIPGGAYGGGSGGPPCGGAAGGGGIAGGGGGANFYYEGGDGGGPYGGAGGETFFTAGDGQPGKGGIAYSPYSGHDGSINGCGRQVHLNGNNGGGGSIGLDAAQDLAVRSTFYPGSGGGGGGGNCDYWLSGGGGGGGGGALRIASGTTISIAGSVLSNGGNGGLATLNSGAGGGGSGGVIYLSAPKVSVTGTVKAEGGSTPCGLGFGGSGRIRIASISRSCTLTGSFNPPLQSGCAINALPGYTYIGPFGMME